MLVCSPFRLRRPLQLASAASNGRAAVGEACGAHGSRPRLCRSSFCRELRRGRRARGATARLQMKSCIRARDSDTSAPAANEVAPPPPSRAGRRASLVSAGPTRRRYQLWLSRARPNGSRDGKSAGGLAGIERVGDEPESRGPSSMRPCPLGRFLRQPYREDGLLPRAWRPAGVVVATASFARRD